MLLIFYSHSSHHGFLQHIFNTIKILRRFLRSGQSHEVSDLFVGHSALETHLLDIMKKGMSNY